MTMDLKKFEYQLDLYGADFARWSAEDAAAARTLMTQSDAARDLFARAQALDNLMAAHAPGPMPDMVLARAMQAIDRHAKPGNDNTRAAGMARLRYGGLALAACAALVILAQFSGGDALPGANGPGPARIATVDESAEQAEVELFVMAMADTMAETQIEEAINRAKRDSAPPDAVLVDILVEDFLASEMGMTGVIQ